jgi:hypothetical protein
VIQKAYMNRVIEKEFLPEPKDKSAYSAIA